MSIQLFLDMAADAWPARTALGSSAASRPMSFGMLRTHVGRGAAELRRKNVKTLAFVGVSSAAVPELLFTAASAHVPFAPLNYRLAPDALAALIGRLDQPLVVADAEFVATLAQAGVTSEIVTTSDWTAHTYRSHDAPSPDAEADIDDNEPAVLLFTSGTTAAPKCVVLRHSHLLSYVLGTVEFGTANPDDCALLSVPPYHIAGIGAAMTNTYSGRRTVYLPDFSPDGWLDLVRSERVSHAMVVPTMLSRIVAHLDGATADCPSLLSLAYGGARTNSAVLLQALASLPTTDFINAYGLTETSSTIALLGPDDHRAALTSRDAERLGSVGRIVPGIEVQIRDDVGEPLPTGLTGELWVRGPQVSGEYSGIGSVLDANGWFPTRDRARLDEDNYLYLDGRADDTIIRGGENISPAEIEDVLLSHTEVEDVAVVGLPDPEWGERMIAVVVPSSGVSTSDVLADELREYVRARLRGSRTPNSVEFVSELPYTATGKLLRRRVIDSLGVTASAAASQLV